MANQHSGSLEHKAREKYNCSAEALLRKYANEDLTYDQIEERIGLSVGTVRKWARRYGLKFRSDSFQDKVVDRVNRFYDNRLNIYNILSRKWC